ncbi:MAG: helix-turn-helix transcriptional regulator [Cohaesibacteraceae bacterium]|nr:helix-turn-helix transcriptional regulator [Cohaesibacteraceae bacterium]
MTGDIDVQILYDDGKPVFAVLPWEDYRRLMRRADMRPTVPHEVVEAVTIEGVPAIKAWREYRQMTQAEVAERAGITRPALAQHETGENSMRQSTLEKLAQALGVVPEQLTFDDDD